MSMPTPGYSRRGGEEGGMLGASGTGAETDEIQNVEVASLRFSMFSSAGSLSRAASG